MPRREKGERETISRPIHAVRAASTSLPRAGSIWAVLADCAREIGIQVLSKEMRQLAAWSFASICDSENMKEVLEQSLGCYLRSLPAHLDEMALNSPEIRSFVGSNARSVMWRN